MDNRIRKAYVLDNLESIINEFVEVPLQFKEENVTECGATEFLLTCPHAAQERETKSFLRDPHTLQVCETVRDYLSVEGYSCKVVAPSIHRKHHDQNRMKGLILACDCVVQLHKYEGKKRQFMHIDIHSFFLGDKFRLPKGWGRGVNIITLHGDKNQNRFAIKLKEHLDSNITDCENATVVAMDSYPKDWEDDNSNSLTEWSRSLGRMSVLIEVPCKFHGDKICHDDSCWKPVISSDTISKHLAAFLSREAKLFSLG